MKKEDAPFIILMIMLVGMFIGIATIFVSIAIFLSNDNLHSCTEDRSEYKKVLINGTEPTEKP